MPGSVSPESRWDARVARARSLAATHAAATDVLNFYAALAEYQMSLVNDREAVERSPRRAETGSCSFVEALDLNPILAAIPDFLAWLSDVAPTGLAASVADMRGFDRARWRHLARSYVGGDGRDIEEADHVRFVLEALLQPFAEQLAIRTANHRFEPASSLPIMDVEGRPDEAVRPARCPVCGALPVVGVLVEEGHGAKRTMLCARCLTDWSYFRLVCPACGEQEFDLLPVYTADQFPYVRIEGCDRCHCYVKTIDLSKDGRAVPCVDDIASVSLDLWAREHGYARLKANLLAL